MLRFNLILIVLFVLALVGCGSVDTNLAGRYNTEVSQSENKVALVGNLVLDPNGTYTATVGQLDFAGKWRAANGSVFLTDESANGQLLPKQYRVDGNRLIAQFEGVDAKHWRFVRSSETVANR